MTVGSGAGGGPPDGGAADSLDALLAGCAAGRRADFAALYRATGARLFGVALRILRDEARAADVVQGAFLAIWRRAGERDRPRRARQAPPLPPLTWMIAIARNRALDRLRRAPGERPLEALRRDGLEPEDPQALAWVASAGEGEGTRLVTCLGALDSQSRRCLLGAYCEALGRAELAEREEAPIGTVNSRLRRGLMGLRRCLDEAEGRSVEPWSEREQLAAEYVLGTLGAPERAELEERAESDAALRGLVEAWQLRLAPLDETTPPVEPPPELWPRIEAALEVEPGAGRRPEPGPALYAHPQPPNPGPIDAGPRHPGRPDPEPFQAEPARPGLAARPAEDAGEEPAWPAEGATGGGLIAGTRSVVEAGRGTANLRRALRRQRWTSLLLGLLAVALAALLLLGPGGLGRVELPLGELLRRAGLQAPEPGGGRLVALLRQDPEPAVLLVELEPARGALVARTLEPLPSVEGDYQLWLVPGEGAPRPLGLLPRDGRPLRLRLPPARRAGLGEALLAISLEPAGGAPGGRPSGDWVFSGRLVALGAAAERPE